jgi:hypothetical protein
MENISNERQVVTSLAIDLIESLYGKQENNNHLLELLQAEFPEDNFKMDDIFEASMLAADTEDVMVLYGQLGYD